MIRDPSKAYGKFICRESLPHSGLALELTAKGTKYYKDGGLN